MKILKAGSTSPSDKLFEQSENRRGKKSHFRELPNGFSLAQFSQLFKTENSSPLSEMIGQVWEGVKIGRAPSLFSVLATREVLNFEEKCEGKWNLIQVVNSSRNK